MLRLGPWASLRGQDLQQRGAWNQLHARDPRPHPRLCPQTRTHAQARTSYLLPNNNSSSSSSNNNAPALTPAPEPTPEPPRTVHSCTRSPILMLTRLVTYIGPRAPRGVEVPDSAASIHRS